MREIVISKNEAGQRLNKLIMKYLNKAPSSFVYRMIRKKNIKLNNTINKINKIINKNTNKTKKNNIYTN